jgi:hypothetical protein
VTSRQIAKEDGAEDVLLTYYKIHQCHKMMFVICI